MGEDEFDDDLQFLELQRSVGEFSNSYRKVLLKFHQLAIMVLIIIILLFSFNRYIILTSLHIPHSSFVINY